MITRGCAEMFLLSLSIRMLSNFHIIQCHIIQSMQRDNVKGRTRKWYLQLRIGPTVQPLDQFYTSFHGQIVPLINSKENLLPR